MRARQTNNATEKNKGNEKCQFYVQLRNWNFRRRLRWISSRERNNLTFFLPWPSAASYSEDRPCHPSAAAPVDPSFWPFADSASPFESGSRFSD